MPVDPDSAQAPASYAPPQWSEGDRHAWRWPDRLTPSQWSGQFRILAKGTTAEPGRFNNDRTPYLAGIMDAWVEEGVEEITVVKATQIGVSLALHNILGYCIDQDPDPALFVLPSEQACKEIFAERIKPLLESSPALKRHMSSRKWDTKTTTIILDSMPLFGGWAGSPTTLAARPIRYVFLDEVDKFPPFSGREADPTSLAYQRTLTYQHRKRIAKVSSPSTREGPIWKSLEASGDRRHFEVPCPFCHTWQPLTFAQIKWPRLDIPDKVRLADEIKVNRLAWYECAKCKARIEDSQKPAMLLRGLWVSQDQQVGPEGELIGERPRSPRIGFHINCLYSPWVRFADVVAEFIRSEGDPAKLMNFRNSWLAEPFELQVAKTAPSFIREKSTKAPPPGVIPSWARALIASADTQGTTARDGWFPYIVRAWGYEFRSQLIEHGIANSFEELRQRCLNKVFPLENAQNLAENAQNAPNLAVSGAAGGGMGPNGIAPQVLFIDSGGPRWSEVYQFAQSDRLRIRPTKGSSTALATLLGKSHQKNHDIVLFNIDTEKAKDLLYRLIHDPDLGKWQVNSGIDEDYIAQMASEHKVLERKTGKELWVKVTSGAANHTWDAEVLQCAAAFDLGAGNPEPRPTPAPANDPKPEKQKFDWVHSRPPIRPRPR